MPDISKDTIKLLSAMEPEEVLARAGEIVLRILQPTAACIAIWDADLENAAKYRLVGPEKKQFKRLFEAYLSVADGRLRRTRVVATNLNEPDVPSPGQLRPTYACPLINEGTLVGYLLVCRPQLNDVRQIDELLDELLKVYPIAFALARAWEYSRVKIENTRLRSQYGELELSIRTTEQDARELINDVMTRDALHTRRLERDRLVYSISNAVRSSVQINEVLYNAVTEIGKSFGVTHCLLLSGADYYNQPVVYEWHRQGDRSVADLVKTVAGTAFVARAMSSSMVQDVNDVDWEQHEREFLSKLELNCGLLIPLVLRDKVLGVIVLKDSNPGRQWSIDDTALLGSLADQLSVAIENAQLHREREMQAATDALTGITNRRRFNEVFRQEFERARRYETPLSLVLVDLDYLKRINDSYGHQVGDEAIKAVARVIQESSRSIDLAARYGGEEFCLLLPNTDLTEARRIARRLQRLISLQHIDVAGNVTASIGVASFPQHGGDPNELFHSADQALYQAKESGRNRVRAA